MSVGKEEAAETEKNKGNELYKAKKFDEALACYEKAIELQPKDLTYYNNKGAVLIEQKKYNECIKFLQDVMAIRHEFAETYPQGVTFEKSAKVFNRLATCYMKLNDYENAIEMYNKSLTERNDRHTRAAIAEAKKTYEKIKREAYYDNEKAEIHREKGNELFKAGEFAAAKLEYDEAIKRNPNDPKSFSNRAATFTKLLAYPDALRDLETCLKLDDKFVKAYSRKGMVHFLMKEYTKALEAYDRGLALDPKNQECINGKIAVAQKIEAVSSSKDIDEEQIKKSMADPEIQHILSDPQMQLVLKNMQENPANIHQYLRDPKIENAVKKLMAAGILRTG